MPKRHHIPTLVLVSLLVSAPAPAHTQPRAGASQDRQARELSVPIADAQKLTRLLVCLREQKPSDCEAPDDVRELLSDYGLGKLVVTETPRLQRTVGTTDAERDAFLISAHRVYKQFKRNASADVRAAVERAAVAQDAVQQLGTQIHERLAEVGMNPPLNAVLRAGYTLADAGDEFPRKLDTGAPPIKSSALGFIEFESKHFGDESTVMDFSFGGSFGVGPALVITRRRAMEPEEPAEEAPASATGDNGAADEEAPVFVPAMVTGLQWSLNARPGFRVGGQSEFSVLGRFGQARLNDLTVKLGDGDDAALADVVRNGTGRWAWFKEAGVEFRIFEKPLETVHHTKDMLLPLFAFGAGFRQDDRLKSQFDLDTFDRGAERYYVRFVVNLAEVLDPRKTESPGKNMFGLKLAVDHQWRRGDSELPSSTRLIVEAAADILKLFNLGEKDKPAETGTRPAAPAR